MENMTEVLVQTGLGEIKGIQHPQRQEFLGIRYAQAPVGKLRFQSPLRIDAWQGLVDAAHYGPMAPQAYPDNPPVQLEESEDCLVLNIYTPAADGKQRPVMVYIHGGGFLIDSGSRPRTHGGPLAEAGDVVVVTIEYRMGAFGFLYAEGLPPNLGLQDQVCALEWVQRHIADFGGAPANVTIFGESAGATSVAYLMVMPSAQGLFHKAILESGAFPFESPADNLRFAQAGTKKFFKHLRIRPGDLSALQAAPFADLQRASQKAAGRLLLTDPAFYPVRDGTVIPKDVHGELRRGCSRKVPVLIGINAEELPLFGGILKPGPLRMIVRKSFLGKMKKKGVSQAQIQRLLGLYRAALPARALAEHREYNHLFSDEFFRIPAILFAEAQAQVCREVYFYTFAHPAPKLGAASHVTELYFVFGTLGTEDIAEAMRYPGTEAEQRLSQAMMAAWSGFARRGNPNHTGLPAWERYKPEQRATMVFELEPHVVEQPFEALRAAWMDIVTGTNLR